MQEQDVIVNPGDQLSILQKFELERAVVCLCESDPTSLNKEAKEFIQALTDLKVLANSNYEDRVKLIRETLKTFQASDDKIIQGLRASLENSYRVAPKEPEFVWLEGIGSLLVNFLSLVNYLSDRYQFNSEHERFGVAKKNNEQSWLARANNSFTTNYTAFVSFHIELPSPEPSCFGFWQSTWDASDILPALDNYLRNQSGLVNCEAKAFFTFKGAEADFQQRVKNKAINTDTQTVVIVPMNVSMEKSDGKFTYVFRKTLVYSASYDKPANPDDGLLEAYPPHFTVPSTTACREGKLDRRIICDAVEFGDATENSFCRNIIEKALSECWCRNDLSALLEPEAVPQHLNSLI